MKNQTLIKNTLNNILKPVFVFNYIFIFSLFISFSMSKFNKYLLFINIKLIVIFFVLTYILPFFTLYTIHSIKIFGNKQDDEFDYAFFIVNLIYLFITWFYFTLLKLPIWLVLIIPLMTFSLFAFFITKNRFNTSFHSISFGAITSFIYYISFIMQGYIGITPFIITILLSGIALSNEIKTEKFIFKQVGISYLIGIFSSVLAILTYLVYQS